MIKLENVDVFGWEATIRGMRNPKNSWDKSDSCFKCNNMECEDCANYEKRVLTNLGWKCDEVAVHIGENDLKLMKALAKAGSDHGKFLRMINVTVDITAPLYWWKEFDTYKVGTVANSCSTMHKIHERDLTLEDFSVDQCEILAKNVYTQHIIPTFNLFRKLYCEVDKKLKTKDRYTEAERKHMIAQKKRFWYNLIQLLPSSYNQRRTVQLNYEVLRAMDRPGRRRDHKLDEWRTFCQWAETLPYFKEICIDD